LKVEDTDSVNSGEVKKHEDWFEVEILFDEEALQNEGAVTQVVGEEQLEEEEEGEYFLAEIQEVTQEGVLVVVFDELVFQQDDHANLDGADLQINFKSNYPEMQAEQIEAWNFIKLVG